ncbi:hypothetical protein D3C77_567820 [compost metagenome]
MDQPDRTEVGQGRENAGDTATEAGFDFGPATGEVGLHLLPVLVNQPHGVERGQDVEDGCKAATEAGLYCRPGTGEVDLHLVPFAIDQIGRTGQHGDNRGDGQNHGVGGQAPQSDAH